MPAAAAAPAPVMPTWAWFVLAWVTIIVVVAPLLGRRIETEDDDWPTASR